MTLTCIIITRNEERNIAACIASAKFSNQIIVVDNKSKDKTVEIAKKQGALVISNNFSDFSKQREEGLKHNKSDWIIYLDADERITPELRGEIEEILKSPNSVDVFKIKRRNFYFGKFQWTFYDNLERLFKKDVIKGWYGKIHESPVIEGKIGELNNYIDHFTHSDLTSMLSKTIEWSDTEARIRLNSSHPRMSWWRFPRVMMTTFFSYYIKQRGYKVGTAGIVESMFQSYSIFITYAKLWEMQNKKPI